MLISDMECSTLEMHKNDIEDIIEYVKINKRISLPTINEKYLWLNINIIQNYLHDECINLGWHIERLDGMNGYCVINIYSL